MIKIQNKILIIKDEYSEVAMAFLVHMLWIFLENSIKRMYSRDVCNATRLWMYVNLFFYKTLIASASCIPTAARQFASYCMQVCAVHFLRPGSDFSLESAAVKLYWVYAHELVLFYTQYFYAFWLFKLLKRIAATMTKKGSRFKYLYTPEHTLQFWVAYY